MIFESKFVITTKLPVDRLWAVISDTSRMNKTMGLPAWDEAELNGSRVVRTKIMGQLQEWVEPPWIWIANQEIRHERIYKKGMMKRQVGVFKILPDKTTNGLSQTEMTFTWTGSPLLRYVIGPLSARFLKKQITWYIDTQERIFFANSEAKTTALTPLRDLNSIDHDFISAIITEVQTVNPEALRKILQNLTASDALDIYKINPKRIATDTQLDVHTVVEELTRLTQFGYLALTWDVVCPHCRGPQLEAAKLHLVSEQTTCVTCDLQFSTQSDRAIEVTFKPQTKFREVKSVLYCAAEPAKKNHILINWPISKDNAFSARVNVPAGRYRARTLHGKKNCEIVVSTNSYSVENVTVDFSKPKLNIQSGMIQFSFLNQADDFIVFESLAWSEEKFLAGEALSNTHIRTLLSDDLLQSGVKLDIGEQIILFTDIVGSTPLYKKLGDNNAFLVVQDHYAEIEQIIKENSGIVVKFIGDAVMAAFTDAHFAFKANQKIHNAFKNNKNSLVLRTSFHIGQVICVNMNVGLDYFGQTVNTAAKLQGWADGFETAVSEQTLKRIPESIRSQLLIKKSGFDEKLQEQVLVF